MNKATNVRITAEFLEERVSRVVAAGYAKQKWIMFCEQMLQRGYSLSIYEARRTVSKYITVKKGKRTFRVRFSNHKPIKNRELAQDCNFFVGWTHTGVRTTEQAIEAVDAFFAEPPK